MLGDWQAASTEYKGKGGDNQRCLNTDCLGGLQRLGPKKGKCRWIAPKRGSRRYGPARFTGAISWRLAWLAVLGLPPYRLRSTRQCPGPLGMHPRNPRRDPLRQLLLMEIIQIIRTAIRGQKQSGPFLLYLIDCEATLPWDMTVIAHIRRASSYSLKAESHTT